MRPARKGALAAAALGLALLAGASPARAKFALREEIDIEAPPEKTWAVLTDLAAWPEWNPFIHYAHGTLEKGKLIDVLVQPTGAKAMKGKGKVVVLDPPREMVWTAKLMFAWVFKGEHHFAVEARPDGKSRFVQSEVFTGVLAPLLRGKINRETKRGFTEMNAALKTRVESSAQRTP